MLLAIIVVIIFVDLGIIFHHLKPTSKLWLLLHVVWFISCFVPSANVEKVSKVLCMRKNLKRLLTKLISLNYGFPIFWRPSRLVLEFKFLPQNTSQKISEGKWKLTHEKDSDSRVQRKRSRSTQPWLDCVEGDKCKTAKYHRLWYDYFSR